jgi:AcrR family transcriptional regulator
VIPTRDRIVFATAELFMQQGYAATGMKQVVTASGAPFGSVYHHFPGGKEQLAEETIRASGRFFGALIESFLAAHPDPARAVEAFFDGAAETLVQTGYANACPIATIALEVADGNERLRSATDEVFASWSEALAARLRTHGLVPRAAGELATAVLAALEGAFMLSRAARSAEPMKAARDISVAAMERALNP